MLHQLQLLWYCRLTLRAPKWISSGFAWYTICHPPSRPIFVRALLLEHMPLRRSTALIWRRWVSSLVRLLTWNEQSVIGYHTWTKLSSNTFIIAILLSFGLDIPFVHILLLSRSNLHVKNSQLHLKRLQLPYTYPRERELLCVNEWMPWLLKRPLQLDLGQVSMAAKIQCESLLGLRTVSLLERYKKLLTKTFSQFENSFAMMNTSIINHQHHRKGMIIGRAWLEKNAAQG